MKKLKLNDLNVHSFATAEPAPAAGTVAGHETALLYCANTLANSCGGTCNCPYEFTYIAGECYNTGGYNTCQAGCVRTQGPQWDCGGGGDTRAAEPI